MARLGSFGPQQIDDLEVCACASFAQGVLALFFGAVSRGGNKSAELFTPANRVVQMLDAWASLAPTPRVVGCEL